MAIRLKFDAIQLMETIQVGLYHIRPENRMGEARKDALLKT